MPVWRWCMIGFILSANSQLIYMVFWMKSSSLSCAVSLFSRRNILGTWSDYDCYFWMISWSLRSTNVPAHPHPPIYSSFCCIVVHIHILNTAVPEVLQWTKMRIPVYFLRHSVGGRSLLCLRVTACCVWSMSNRVVCAGMEARATSAHLQGRVEGPIMLSVLDV